MQTATIGIIGGTGLGDVLAKEAGGTPTAIDTPYGPPSSEPVLANWEGVDVAFIARHGAGHRFNPSAVPYRANIFALKKLGVSAILASGATGSLREEIEPGQLVLCDQVIDKTFRRAGTFFDEGMVAHVELAEPFCPAWRALLSEAAKGIQTKVHPRGTYVCMEGPQFSTRAESHMHRAWGGDLIGMTCMPEAKLAREAEICYALIALPTDYDCWRPTTRTGGQDALLAEILGNLRRATDNAVALLHETLKLFAASQVDHGRAERVSLSNVTCGCHDALKLAIWSDREKVDPAIQERLAPLIGRYDSTGDAKPADGS